MITTDTGLSEWLPRFREAEWLAVDTEADSLHSYPEKICLIQISIPGHDLLIDPLAKIDLQPLLTVFHERELLMHGSDYDLRLLQRGHRFVAGKIFDTMIAARLLGLEQFGLSNLVEKFLGIKLDKGSQKADWSRRPLSPRMEDYARNDTRHLHAIVTILRAELIAKGRLAWQEESCAQLVAECAVPRVDDPDEIWRVKGSYRLGRRSLAVLRDMWYWRDAEARSADRPPFFILSHEVMVHLASLATHEPFAAHFPRHLSPGRRAGLTRAIEKGLACPEAEWPHPPEHKGRRPTEAENRRMDQLKNIRDRHAKELGIDPTLIASRAMLLALAQDWEKHTVELMKWQRELLK